MNYKVNITYTGEKKIYVVADSAEEALAKANEAAKRKADSLCLSNAYYTAYPPVSMSDSIIQPKIDAAHGLVYWYGGRIAEVKHRGYTFVLGAYGDVCCTLVDETGVNEIVSVKDKSNAGRFYDEMHRYISDDAELISLEEKGRLIFDNNNWFEVLVDGPDGKQYDTGWVCDSDYYDEALNEMLVSMDDFIMDIETGEI